MYHLWLPAGIYKRMKEKLKEERKLSPFFFFLFFKIVKLKGYYHCSGHKATSLTKQGHVILLIMYEIRALIVHALESLVCVHVS